MRISNAEIEAMKIRLAEQKAELIDDDDIAIVAAWDRLQNIESSEKLLDALRKYHGVPCPKCHAPDFCFKNNYCGFYKEV